MKLAGYSGTPLLQKLGIKAGMGTHLVNAPADYPLREAGTAPYDFIHFFTKEKKELLKKFPELKKKLSHSGMLWISWPKGASKVPTDLNDNVVREIGLAKGLVDVKVCAVDELWSGLKFVYRLKDRVYHKVTKAQRRSKKEE